MKEIADLESTQILLFGVGQVPYKYAQTRDGTAQIKEHFKFKLAGNMPLTSELVFEGGVAEGTGERATITRLQIGDRRMILTVAADSATTEKVLEDLRKILAGFDPASRFEKATPITHRHETTCSATLDFDWRTLFNPVLAEFFESRVAKATSDSEAGVSISHATCRVTFSYSIKSELITQSGITFSPKDFVVEPLASTPLAARRYFTASPTDSKMHLKLLEDLETALTRAPTKAKTK